MLLNKLLQWILNNPLLLALQDFLVSPVLKRLPSARYGTIRYRKNVLFKLFGFGAGTLTCRHLEKNDVELSRRYACEIVANQGYVFYTQDWKVYLLYVGLIHAHKREYEKASLWLAEGIVKQSNRLLNSVKTESYPEVFTQWLENNLSELKSPEGWQRLFSESGDSEQDYELLLIYISICIFSLQLKELIVVFFDRCEIAHHSDWKKMIVYRQRLISPSRYRSELSHNEIWHGTYPDIGQKLAANILFKTFCKNATVDTHDNADFRALAEIQDYMHVSHDLFPLIMSSCNLLSQSKYEETIALLEPVTRHNSEFLSSMHARIGPTKLFLAGFGWSGSSAVHDACRGYQHTKEMPGAGSLPALNIGADSEPMVHQGAGSLNELIFDIKSMNQISDLTLKRFFKNYTLLMPSFEYLEYKTVNATKNIIEQIGLDHYYLFVCEFLSNYAVAMCYKDKAAAIDAVESFHENIINAMFSDSDAVFFNNSIFAHRAKILNNIRGRSYYIVVNRQMSDQFCDQMRSNKFFNATFLEFYLVKLSRIIAYNLAKRSPNNENVEFIDIMFEAWIQDDTLREHIARKIFGTYDKEIEAKFFCPEKSKKNINISRDNMSSFDRRILGVFEKVGLRI
jgi:hypothetical protein